MNRMSAVNNLLLTVTVGLTLFGLAMVASTAPVAEPSAGFSFRPLYKQAVIAALSLAIMLYIRYSDYTGLNRPVWVFLSLAGALVSLTLVYFFGKEHRWFRAGFFSFQPSEFAKPALVLFLSYLLARQLGAINHQKYTLVPALGAIILLVGAVIIPDVGTAFVMAITAGIMLFMAGVKIRYFLTVTLAFTVIFVAAIIHKPYRLARIFALYDPQYSFFDTRVGRFIDPNGTLKAYLRQHAPTESALYHLEQSRIAVGSGGIFGKGLGASTQKLRFLPEAHTDFIYAIVAEECGLVGAVLLLAAYLIIFGCGLCIYARCPEPFGKFLAFGLSSMILTQALFNMSVVLGLVPTKGIPLPLISDGGSSLSATLVSLGLIQSVGNRWS